MKDPLTKKERKEFKRYVLEILDKEYDKALASGAFDEKKLGNAHNHSIIKIALRQVASQFRLLSEAAKDADKNYARI